jgi:lipoprotein-releasing system ATP-binding protein
MSIIQAENLRKSFGPLEVLGGVSLSVEPGEIVAITGASGAGKTTLLEILGTLSSPDSGTLRIGGKDVLTMPEKEKAAFRGKRIGFVFQAHHLLPEFTAEENVMIPALIAGENASKAKARARELLAAVGLEGRRSHKPAELSGGESQRVAIARAIVNAPEVVFADEPTGNLDSVTKEEIHRLIFELRERTGQTFVIVTHDPALAARCDRSITLVDGTIQ